MPHWRSDGAFRTVLVESSDDGRVRFLRRSARTRCSCPAGSAASQVDLPADGLVTRGGPEVLVESRSPAARAARGRHPVQIAEMPPRGPEDARTPGRRRPPPRADLGASVRFRVRLRLRPRWPEGANGLRRSNSCATCYKCTSLCTISATLDTQKHVDHDRRSLPVGLVGSGGLGRQLRRLNAAAYAVFQKGHVPIVGVNLALPVVEAAGQEWYSQITQPLSLRLTHGAMRC